MKPTQNILMSLLSSLMLAAVCTTAVTVAEAASGQYVEPKINHQAYGSLKIVVPITTDDKAIQGMKLRNLENSLESGKQWNAHIQSTVVLYANGLSLLKSPDAETRKMIDALKANSVKFVVCNNSLREQGIDFHQLYNVSESAIVPSGFAEVAYLQAHQSYVVDPAN